MEELIWKLVVIVAIALIVLFANKRLNKNAELSNIIYVVTIVVASFCALFPAIDLIKLAIHS